MPFVKRRYLALVVVFFAAAFSATWAPQKASLDFYSATAQIIPVLLLVIVLEARVFDLRAFRTDGGDLWDRAFNVVLALLILGVMVLGEFSALRALAHANTTYGSAQYVYQALGAGFAAVVMIGVGAPLRPRARADDD